MRVPSGDQEAPTSAAVESVTCLSCPVRMLRIHRLKLPDLSEEYTNCDPSGDQAGSAFTEVSFVSRSGLEPIFISHKSPTATNATCFASGEITGRTIPKAFRGAFESKSRFLRV